MLDFILWVEFQCNPVPGSALLASYAELSRAQSNMCSNTSPEHSISQSWARNSAFNPIERKEGQKRHQIWRITRSDVLDEPLVIKLINYYELLWTTIEKGSLVGHLSSGLMVPNISSAAVQPFRSTLISNAISCILRILTFMAYRVTEGRLARLARSTGLVNSVGQSVRMDAH